jgi:hypothetical protein
MGNVYVDGRQHIDLQWALDRYPDAMALRNRKAKELRRQGYEVNCGKYEFTDLARTVVYWLEAAK